MAQNKAAVDYMVSKHQAVDWLSILPTKTKYSPASIQKALPQKSPIILFVKLKNLSRPYTKDGKKISLKFLSFSDHLSNPFFKDRYGDKLYDIFVYLLDIEYELKCDKMLFKKLLSERIQNMEKSPVLEYMDDVGDFYAIIAVLDGEFSISGRSITMYGRCLDYVYIKGLLAE